ncbi:MAG: hypothetical protein ABH860_00290 [bacterium]
MKKTFLLMICSCLFILPASAELDIGGYYKNELANINDRYGHGLSVDVNKLRLKVDYELTPTINFHLEPEYVSLLNQSSVTLADVSKYNEVVWDRTYVKINFPDADLTVGKQRVAWGTGMVWNPTDVFNPFALSFAVAEEERRGVEGVRLSVPWGVASAVEYVVLTDREIERAKKGFKVKTNVNNYDMSASYVNLGGDGYQFGFDTAGELFDQGLYAEGAFVHPASGNTYKKLVLGWNYTLENSVGLNAEYFFNGQGALYSNDYDWASLLAGEIHQLGRNYCYFGINKMLDEITDVRLSFLSNIGDGSFIIYPAYSRNIFQNVDLSLEAMFPGGSEGTEYNPDEGIDPTGLIGSQIYFIKLKWSF